MKTKVLLLSLVSLLGLGNAWAQQIENDDMYFNSKDRAKLRASQKTNELAYASVKKERKNEASEETLNPTDTYSARNVNPEYTSRAQSQTARADDEDYFVNNYQYNNRNNYNNWNNNFNNWYGNSWYRPNYWGPSISGWNSPYYGYYDSWNSPWYDPYWSYNGWSTSFSYYYGNSWDYGWGGNYSYWNRPYCNSYNPYYGGAFGFGGGYWNNYRGANTVIIVNNGEAGRTISHGKRPTRGSYVVSDQNGSRSRSSVGSSGQRGNDLPGGRVSSSRPPEYYNRSWRTTDSNSSVPASTSYGSRSSTQNNRPSSWSNNTPDNNSSWGNTNSSSSPSRSSFDSGGGATRTHSPAPASSGGGSNGRSRRD